MGALKSRIQDQFLDSLIRNSDKEVYEMLKKYPQLANQPLHKATTNPICRASYMGYRNIVIILLENGADINMRSSDGRTPFMWAAFKGDLKLIDLLAERGSKIELEDENGLNAFDLAVCQMLYKTAFHLYKNYGMRPKTKEVYELHTVGG